MVWETVIWEMLQQVNLTFDENRMREREGHAAREHGQEEGSGQVLCLAYTRSA